MSHRTAEGLQAGFPIAKARELGHSIPSQPLNDNQTLPQGIDGVPIIVNGQIIGWNIQNEFFTQAEVDSLIASGNFPEDTPGTGGTARSFASTQAAQTQAEAFARSEREAGQEFSAEERRLAEEGANRRDRLGALTRLIEGFLGQQSQARDTLANLQPDPFRFAAVAGGIAPFGATPQQGFQQQLQQFAGASVPQFDPSGSAASLDPIIAQLTGAQAPQAPQEFGFAEGGTIEMAKGADGTFSVAPSPAATARLVGEGRHGEGLAAGTAEVMIVTPQGTTVLPLSSGMAEGGAIGFNFDPIKFDASTLLPALGTSGIFSDFPSIPRGRPGLAGGLGAGQRGVPFSQRGIGILEQMGIQPGLIRFGDETSVFFRNPEGQLERFRDTGAFLNAGFDRANVTRFAPGTKEGFDFAAPFRGRPDIPTEAPSPFTKFSAPIVEPTTGTLLPAPFTVASQLNKLRLTNPAAFNLLLSAYTSAGVPAMAVLSGIQSALPFGQARGNIGLN